MRRFFRGLSLALAGLLCAAVFVPSAHAQISIWEARQQGVDSTVTVEGTVTRAFGDFVRFQDESGPTGASALVVRQTSGAFQDSVAAGAIRPGTQLQVSGTLSEFNGLLQINEGDLDSYAIQGQGSVPAPQDVTLSTIKRDGENYESELIRVTGLNAHEEGTFAGNTSYTVSDGSGSDTFAGGALTLRVQGAGETNLGGTAIPEGVIEYTGVVGEFRNQYQLIPVREDDVTPVRSFGFTRSFVQAEEGSGTVEVNVEAFATQGDDVSVTAQVGGASTATNGTDVTGFSSPQSLTFTGSDPAPKTLSFTVESDSDTEGVERLEVVLDSDDGAIARPERFTVWVLDGPTAQTTLAAGDSGDVLIDSLQQRYGDPRTLGYDAARDSMYATVYNDGGTVEGTYSGFQVSVSPDADDPSAEAADQGINTEHTWPQSKGAGQEPATSNLHILVPTRDAVNSARSNLPYGESPDSDTDAWFFEDQRQASAPPEADRPRWSELLNGERFEPRHGVKGDVARAVFYFVTVYPDRTSRSFYDAQKDSLLAWHRRDPVDATELRRTILQAGYQDNALNPFVLDSTLADRAYGSGGGTPSGSAIPISEARSQGVDAGVTIRGTVTRAFGSYARIQDESGPTGASGIVIRQTSGSFSSDFQQDISEGTITKGTILEVSGTLSAFNGLLQINNDDLNSYAVEGQGTVPDPQAVSLSDLTGPNGEDYESELLRIGGLSFPNASGPFEGGTTYTVENEGGTSFEFRVQDEAETDLIGASIPTGTFTYEGVLGQFNGDGFVEGSDEGYQLIPIRPETALPVEFVAFDATRGGASVVLTWNTASETNNASFRVQRAEAGPSAWTTVGAVEGAGTTTEPQAYRFTDDAIPAEADALTYRLKQVDTDGSTSYSDPVTVQYSVKETRLRAPAPNPVRNRATVRYALPERQAVTLRVYDVLGRQVTTLVDDTQEGRRQVTFEASDLSSGVYFLRLATGGKVHTERVTVVR